MVKIEESHYFSLVKDTAGFAHPTQASFTAQKALSFKYGTVTYEQFVKSPPKPKHYLGRKIIALPAFLVLSIVSVVKFVFYHIAKIFIGIHKARIDSDDKGSYIKAQFFQSGRDFQRAAGWLTFLFHTTRGEFMIQEASFHQSCYTVYETGDVSLQSLDSLGSTASAVSKEQVNALLAAIKKETKKDRWGTLYLKNYDLSPGAAYCKVADLYWENHKDGDSAIEALKILKDLSSYAFSYLGVEYKNFPEKVITHHCKKGTLDTALELLEKASPLLDDSVILELTSKIAISYCKRNNHDKGRETFKAQLQKMVKNNFGAAHFLGNATYAPIIKGFLKQYIQLLSLEERVAKTHEILNEYHTNDWLRAQQYHELHSESLRKTIDQLLAQNKLQEAKALLDKYFIDGHITKPYWSNFAPIIKSFLKQYIKLLSIEERLAKTHEILNTYKARKWLSTQQCNEFRSRAVGETINQLLAQNKLQEAQTLLDKCLNKRYITKEQYWSNFAPIISYCMRQSKTTNELCKRYRGYRALLTKNISDLPEQIDLLMPVFHECFIKLTPLGAKHPVLDLCNRTDLLPEDVRFELATHHLRALFKSTEDSVRVELSAQQLDEAAALIKHLLVKGHPQQGNWTRLLTNLYLDIDNATYTKESIKILTQLKQEAQYAYSNALASHQPILQRAQELQQVVDYFNATYGPGASSWLPAYLAPALKRKYGLHGRMMHFQLEIARRNIESQYNNTQEQVKAAKQQLAEIESRVTRIGEKLGSVALSLLAQLPRKVLSDFEEGKIDEVRQQLANCPLTLGTKSDGETKCLLRERFNPNAPFQTVQKAYQALGLPVTGATFKEYKKQYRKLSLRLHPDKGGDPKEFQKISAAYKFLNDIHDVIKGAVK